jgi:hypothetical protein
MNVRRTCRYLNATAALLTAAGLAALVLTFLLPPRNSPQASGIKTNVGLTSHDPAPELPAREAFEPLLALDLRRPLYDAAPTVAAAAAKVIPSLRLKLVGTVVEPPAPGSDPTRNPASSYAIFTNAQGKTQFLSPGETAEEATILAVTETTVTLRYYDQEQTLTLEPPEGKSPPPPPEGKSVEAKLQEATKRQLRSTSYE